MRRFYHITNRDFVNLTLEDLAEEWMEGDTVYYGEDGLLQLLDEDVVYQAGDLMFPDEGGADYERYRTVGLDNPGQAARISRNMKHNEQKNYDISRDKAARGETFFSAADLFDDSGKGDILGLKDSAKRKDKGSKTNESWRGV